MDHGITVLHVLGASLWIGGLATLAVLYARVDQGLLRRLALVPISGLALLALTGLLVATKYGDPAAWFKMGTTIGKIGEKITALAASGVLAGLALHRLTRRGPSLLVKTSLAAALVISLGALYLGVSLTKGA